MEVDTNALVAQIAEAVRESIKEEFKEIKKRLDDVEARLAKIETRLDNLEEKVDDIDSRLMSVQGAVFELKDEIGQNIETTNYLIRDVYILKNRRKHLTGSTG